MPSLGVTWQIASNYGWGTFGLNIVSNLASDGRWTPVLLHEPGELGIDPLEKLLLRPVLERSERLRADMRAATDGRDVSVSMPLFHALGNGASVAFTDHPHRFVGTWNGALTFLENTRLEPDQADRFNRFDQVIAGSSWARDVLHSAGVRKAKVSLQGVDPATFHPAARRRALGGKFLIFTGGKFEYRKAQDAVMAAFRAFHARHPDAVLIAVWGNPWAETLGVRMFEQSSMIDGPPPLTQAKRIDWSVFMARERLAADALAIFESVPHLRLGHIMRECDVALFPNRAEGGTNLVAMEAMACGLPTILSANTGHLDIMSPENCLALNAQGPVASPDARFGTDGWGEPDVEEILEALERVYRDRDGAARIGAAAAESMKDLSWRTQIDALMSACELE